MKRQEPKLLRGFIGPAYEDPSLAVNNQRTVNFLLEVDQTQAKTPVALHGVPGLRLVTTLAGGTTRGYIEVQGVLYAAVGQTFGKVGADNSFTVLGSYSGTGRVVMKHNGLQICVVDGLSGFIYTLASMAWTQITAPGFVYGATQLAYQDGYFVTQEPNSQRFSVSGLYDGLTWTDIDFASTEGLPDDGAGIIANHRLLHIFGTQSLELWVNQGTADFPFVRMDGSFFEVGCAAPYSVAIADDSVFWLGNNAQGGLGVYRMEGTSPKRVSTPALEKQFRSYEHADAFAVGLDVRKHPCYVITFPSENKTWVFDAMTGSWAEWLDFIDGEYMRHRLNCVAYVYDKVLIGDYRDGRLYHMTFDAHDNAGDPIRRVRQSPFVWMNNKRIFHSMLELHMETGVGIDGVGQGVDPTVMLRWSNDGFNFSPELHRPIGKIGERDVRVRFNRLGSARSRLYEVVVSDPVKVIIYGASLEAN